MATIISCVDRSRLQQLLALPGASDERRALDAHLGQCDACRTLLLEFTSEAMRLTLTAAPNSESMTTDLSGSRTQDKSDGGCDITQTRVREREFLDPARDPEHLGRLAHYELLEVIGRGGMGTVFKAHDETLHRTVAVKMMSPELAVSDTSRQRFIREARAAAQVTHEHVVTIHAVDDGRRVPFLVMQYVEGQSLQQRLQDGPLPIDEIIRIGREVAAGLAAAHAKGLVHRDIKPGNVLLEKSTGKVKITDFGLARAVDDASISQSGAVIGTPLYMAPEQARGEPLDHRADLFSLGAVLYALCTGQSPFRANTSLAAMRRACDDDPEPIKPINAEVPGWFERMIRKLLEKRPADRFQSAEEVVQLLDQQIIKMRAGKAGEEDIATETMPPVRRKSRLPIYAAAVCVLIAAGILIAIQVNKRDRNENKSELDKSVAKNNAPINFEPRNAFGDGANSEWNGGVMPDPNLMMRTLFENHPFLQPGGFPRLDPIADNPLMQNPEIFRSLFAQLGGGVNVPQPGWMANSPDGKIIAVPLGGDVALMGEKGEPFDKIETPIHCLAISLDNRWLVGGCDAKSVNVVVWDLMTGKIKWKPEGHRGEINSVACGMGSRFVTASNDGTAKVWAFGTKSASATFADHKDFVRCATFYPRHLRVVSGGDDKVVRIWDATNGKAIKELPGHSLPIRTIIFSPNGKVLVTGSDAEMKLWDAESFEEFITLPTPSGWLAFSPDGLTLFSAGVDHSQGTPHTVVVWNTRSWEKRTTYDLKTRGGQAVYHLSGDGGILLGCRPNGLGASPVGVYQALTGKELLAK